MSLARLLGDQQARLEALVRLLEEEQTQLLPGRIDGNALARLAQEKGRLIAALEATEATRARVQRRLGYPNNGEGARQAATDAGCSAQWQATLALASHTARLNARNGRLIDLRMHHNQRLLEQIQRLVEPSVYTADGRPSRGGRRLEASA